ncbi:restriction endonuclease subunit S [Aeromicrobium sp.]|uniref:restriction endonuclease subunit S n=1 Tax=Aeromicrobium sp. TaxID=1871063 RepID=UPI004033D974
MTALGDVCTVRSSLVDPTRPEFARLPHIAPDRIEKGSGRLLNYRTAGEDGVTSGKYRFEAGDVLYSKIRPNLNKVALVDLAGICSADMYALDVDRNLATPEYVAQLLRSQDFLDYATSLSNRANIPKLNREQLLRFDLHLPSLPEQQRIAAILDHADALRAKRCQVLARLDSLTQSIFHDMFGNSPASVSIGEALSDAPVFTDGDWVESKDQDPGGDVRLTQLADVGDGQWVDKSSRFLTSAKAAELRCTYLQAGDVLVARMPDPLGRACIFPGSNRPSVTVVDVCIIRSLEGRHSPTWLMAAINSPATRNQIARLATGTTRSRVSRGNLAKVTIPVVSFDAQKRFTGRVEQLNSQERAARSALTVHEGLFASLQSRAFRGEL